MRKKTYILLTVLFLSFFGEILAQNTNTLIAEIQSSLKEVALKTSINKQSIVAVTETVVRYTRNEQRTNGKTTEFQYTFSLADINPLSVHKNTDRDLLYVEFAVKAHDKYIKCEENGVTTNYESTIVVYAENNENAEKLVALFKKAAEEGVLVKQKKNLPQAFHPGIEWIIKNVENSDNADNSFHQTISKVKGKETSITITTQHNTKEYTYEVNMADIDPYTIKLDISGTELRVIADVFQNQKFIKLTKSDKVEFIDGFDLYFVNLDMARDFVTVLQKIVFPAKELYTQHIPQVNSANAIIQIINTNIKNVALGTKSYMQEYAPDCKSKFTQITENGTTVYSFMFSDITQKLSPIQIKTNAIALQMQVQNNMRLITEYENGVVKSYTSNFTIYFDDIDKARETQVLLERTIAYCKENEPKQIARNYNQKIQWLVQNLGAIETNERKVQQKLSQNAQSKMLTFTVTNSSTKTSEELVYEFKWDDMAAGSVQYTIDPSAMGITIITKNNAKVINCSRNGAVKNYTNRLYFEFSDIEILKTAHSIITDLIKESQENSK